MASSSNIAVSFASLSDPIPLPPYLPIFPPRPLFSSLPLPSSRCVCSHAFKCKSDPDANAIAFAAARTVSTNARRKPLSLSDAYTPQDLEAAVARWNACNPKLFHFEIGKDSVVSGNIKVSCQVDASLKVSL